MLVRLLQTRGASLALGMAVDALFGDPQRHHPVALYGTAATRVERRIYKDSRLWGVAYVGLVAVVPAAMTYVLSKASRPLTAALTVAAVATSLGGTTLARVAEDIARSARRGDIEAARAKLPWLVGRDVSSLDESGIARATIESVAENTSDAVSGVIVWTALCGLPGCVAFRMVNTLDAMVGHKNDRYLRFGMASARLDDLLGLIPSRATALAFTVCAPLVGGRPQDALRAWRHDAPAHPSPNAGPVEATAAGALGVRLGGVNVYHGTVENRGTLGDGREPTMDDISRMVALSRYANITLATAAVGLLTAASAWRRRHTRKAGA